MTENHYDIVLTNTQHSPSIAALQQACFPKPFPQELLWQASHIDSHLKTFPQGQFVALHHNRVIASCTNMLVTEQNWLSHKVWQDITGGPHLPKHNPQGTILYGIDISVHPNYRKQGIAKALYKTRFNLLSDLQLKAYGTVCRLPGYHSSGYTDPTTYAHAVTQKLAQDPTLTPLLKMNLTYSGIIPNYMDDEESGHAGAILEYRP